MDAQEKRLPAAVYWRLKAGVLESALDDARAELLAERAQWRRRLALAAAGLDAGKFYQLDDERQAVTQVDPNNARQPPGAQR